jgi:hypothetical protein
MNCSTNQNLGSNFSQLGFATTNGSVSKPCTPSVHIKIAGLKWMFIPLKMLCIGIDP